MADMAEAIYGGGGSGPSKKYSDKLKCPEVKNKLKERKEALAKKKVVDAYADVFKDVPEVVEPITEEISNDDQNNAECDRRDIHNNSGNIVSSQVGAENDLEGPVESIPPAPRSTRGYTRNLIEDARLSASKKKMTRSDWITIICTGLGLIVGGIEITFRYFI